MRLGAIVIIVIATTGVLMMRFRKRWLAKINLAFTNRITSLFERFTSPLNEQQMTAKQRGAPQCRFSNQEERQSCREPR